VNKKVKVAVLLNGSGHRDGSEIQESVLTLLAIEAVHAEWQGVALDEYQAKTLNHYSGAEEGERRNMLIESARIARGRISDVRSIDVQNFDALIIPGGSGTASNLCDFASSGAEMMVHLEVLNLIRSFHRQRKPIGGICIAPMLLAGSLKEHRVTITLGSVDNRAATAAAMMGATTVASGATEICLDSKNRLVTTPAYMCEASIPDIYQGITKLVQSVTSMASQT
jgi:enhancing lycopene biosynthesis protein 2